MTVFDAMKIALVVAGLCAALTQTWQGIKQIKHRYPGAWIHIFLGVMMLYWAVYYARSYLGLFHFSPHQVYVRGPLLITIALIGAAGVYGIRRYK